MIDYHLHGNFCGHGSGRLEEYVLAAIDRGLSEIGFSAHLPKVVDPDPYHAMLEDDLPRYVKTVRSLQDEYGTRIKIKLGIEADYFEGFEEKTRALLSAHPFDYVIGSIHFLGDWHFTSRAGLAQYGREDPNEAFPRYFELLRKMISTGLFDIVGHPDAIRRSYFVPTIPLEGEYRATAELIEQKGMSAEVNTAGLRRDAGSIYPAHEFLSVLVAEGVPLTIGSDAHRPDDVGRDFDSALSELKRFGVERVAVYERRKRSLVPLEPSG
ncbi:MAG: hypothetical protein B6D63_00255 [Candidatus Latescibacteria bacterium 4484_7]|nr:MAG: hypothetical protein B6D63_00255 [Candidatus Latescibacteria bacterium 4484_7]